MGRRARSAPLGRVIEFEDGWPVLPLEEIQPVLSPLHQSDVRSIFTRLPPARRPDFLLWWTGQTVVWLAQQSGIPRTNLVDWLARRGRLPFGAAVRLARVFGVPPEELFEGWL